MSNDKEIEKELFGPPVETDDLKLLESWNKLGFQVIKGSKAIWERNYPMFTSDQVKRKTRKKS